jgi:hypothetical protein
MGAGMTLCKREEEQGVVSGVGWVYVRNQVRKKGRGTGVRYGDAIKRAGAGVWVSHWVKCG